MRTIWVVFGLFVLVAITPAAAQPGLDGPASKHEFRGAWIATVVNLDWPTTRGTNAALPQDRLVEMLDKLKDAGINAVFFQVRSECDAMYASEIEPWSYWLTGEQGRAPEPFYESVKLSGTTSSLRSTAAKDARAAWPSRPTG